VIQEEAFRLSDYHAFLDRIAAEATSFKAKQQAAFEAERERWKSTEFVSVEEPGSVTMQEEIQLPEHGSYIDAPVAGSLWKLIAKKGERVQLDQPVAIIESMKMEMQVCPPQAGIVHSVLCKEFSPVSQGQHLFIIEIGRESPSAQSS
jgi:urea carboxylase